METNTVQNVKKNLIFALFVLSLLVTSIFSVGLSIKNSPDISLSRAALAGDCNTDNRVDLIDFQILSNSFGKSNGQTGYSPACDFDSSNSINLLDFQMLSNNFGKTGQNTPTPTSPTIPPPPPDNGIWISHTELMNKPTSGSAWTAIVASANKLSGGGDIGNQDSKHDQYTLAAAYVCARTGQSCEKAVQGLTGTIGSEEGDRWLGVGRNLLSYTIAADVLKNSGRLSGADLTRVQTWLGSFLTRKLPSNNSGAPEVLLPFESGSNASAQEGAGYAAVAALTGNTTKLNYVWNRFRLYSCDKTDNPETEINITAGFQSGWSHASTYSEACAVNPKGSVKSGHSIDGVVINDIRRGANFQWPPVYTQYEWTGLEGYIPAAYVLYRAGYPAFNLKEQAVLRAGSYTCFLKTTTGNDGWWDPTDHKGAKQLLKFIYGYSPSNCGIDYPTGEGMIIGFTDWTHPR